MPASRASRRDRRIINAYRSRVLIRRAEDAIPARLGLPGDDGEGRRENPNSSPTLSLIKVVCGEGNILYKRTTLMRGNDYGCIDDKSSGDAHLFSVTFQQKLPPP